MNIFVSQIYIEVGASYPFTHFFQKYLSKEITARVPASDKFVAEYGPDFDLMFRLSAKKDILEPEIKGPTVFMDDKDVEFTVFLPYSEEQSHAHVLDVLIKQIVDVLEGLGMDVEQLSSASDEIVQSIVTDPKMVE
ncbi:MAG: hypothetical protein IH987_20070 [Planctomycetes bacterium]|nr:hypothetical protein [Planctomycetota bacterium]